MSAAVEKLIEARELLARPDGWLQHEFARNADGRVILPESEDAVCFCASGAIRRAAPGISDASFLFRERLRDLVCRGAGRPERIGELPNWNDAPGRTQAEVVAAFDRAIELARAAA